MTNEELQEICDKIQGGWKDADCYPTGSKLNKLSLYHNRVMIYGTEYAVDLNHKIINGNVEL